MKLTARGLSRVLRVARTLADLDGAEKNRPAASAERCRIARSPMICGARRKSREALRRMGGATAIPHPSPRLPS